MATADSPFGTGPYDGRARRFALGDREAQRALAREDGRVEGGGHLSLVVSRPAPLASRAQVIDKFESTQI